MKNETKVAIVSTVKSPANQIEQFIKYHKGIGIDHIFLFFDDPKDTSIPVFLGVNGITVMPCSSQYWEQNQGLRPESIEKRQIANVNYAVHELDNFVYDWIIHIDSDELVHAEHGLKQTLKECDAGALKFDLFEAVPEKLHYKSIFCPTLFKRKASKYQFFIAKALGCRRSFFNNEFFRGHTASKMAVKVNSNILKYGIHGPMETALPIAIKKAKTIKLLHFDCIGLEDWKNKWYRRVDGSGKAISMRKNRVTQFELFKAASSQGERGLEDLYTNIHLIPLHEKIILKSLFMLTTFSLHRNILSI